MNRRLVKGFFSVLIDMGIGRVYIEGHWRPYELIFYDYVMANDIRGWMGMGPKFSRHLSYD